MPSKVKNNKKMTIMVVEDEDLLLRAITQKLTKIGCGVVSCRKGQQALDYLNDLPELPDAIWLDYYLTDMNGLEFMETLQKNSKWKNILVIVVSNSASDEKVSHMLALGAQKYILKAEHRLEDIIKEIEKLINKGR